MEKSVVMTFRVTPEDAARIREAVGEGNFSEYVRAKLLTPTRLDNPHVSAQDEPEWKKALPLR